MAKQDKKDILTCFICKKESKVGARLMVVRVGKEICYAHLKCWIEHPEYMEEEK